MFYISFVRNLTNVNVKNPKAVDNLRQHLSKGKVKHDFVITYEISPAKGTHHLHALIIVEDMESFVHMTKYLDTHQLKAYVDKWQQVNTLSHAQALYKYIHKDVTESSLLYKDMMRSNDKIVCWHDDYGHLTKQLVEDKYLGKTTIPMKDPDDEFIDSDTMDIIKY